jgi:hypothetical protein
MNWIESVAKSLVDRGTRLNAPARAEDISCLLAASPILVPPQLIEVFRSFDGFPDEDLQSNILVWSTSMIVDHLRKTSDRPEYLPIADFFIGSETICLKETSEVFWEDRKTTIAPDFANFMVRLSSGEYDT